MGFEFFHVGTEKNQCSQTRRRDSVTFCYRLHRVTNGIELVCRSAHFFAQLTHDRDAAGVIRNGAKGIERNDDSCHRQHGHHGDGDPVEIGEAVTEQNRDANKTDRQSRGMLANGETGDDTRPQALLRRDSRSDAETDR